MSQSQDDFWEGYNTALIIMGKELDKVLTVCYNDRRTQNDLLDLRIKLKELEHHGESATL